MKKAISITLVFASILFILCACSKGPVETLETIDTDYVNGYAVITLSNNSGETITSVEGRIVLWSSNNTNLGGANYIWNGSCAPGETLEIELEIPASGIVDRVGYSISSINNGSIPEFLS